MALFRPEPPLLRGRSLAPFGPTPGSNATGTAAGTSTVQGFAPFGAGTAAGTSSAAGVGASLASTTGTAAGTSSATGTTSNIFPLSISSDGRYLKQSDGTPFLICADTTWSLAVDIPLSGVTSFLNTITGQGFNGVSMNIIEHHYTTVKPPKSVAGNLPFTQRLDGTTFTGSPNGTTGANGTQGQFSADNYSSISTQAPDPTFINTTYWADVETILNACLAHNVMVFAWVMYLGFHADDEGWITEMVVWDGITGAGGFTGQPWADGTKSKMWNFGAWLANRWKAYPNIVWVMGGDYGSNTQTLSTPQQNAVNNVMAGMKSVSGQASTMFTAHWDRPALATDTTLAAGSFDLNLCYCDEAVAELARRGYAHTPASPTFIGEYYYEDDLFGGSVPFRKYVYWGFLGGIAGGFFGNEQLWRFDDGTPGTDYTTLLSTQATLDAQRQFALWRTKKWWLLKPSGLGGMGTLVTAGGGTASPQSTDYVAAAATAAGDLLMAYVPAAHTGSVTLDMTNMSATVEARWFDPTNSAFTVIGAFPNTSTHAFTTPGSNNAGDADWLLLLETVAGTIAGTSTVAGVGAALASTAGSITASSTATAVSQSTATSAGTAAGTSTATATSATILATAGTAAGSATATGVGAATDTGVGTAAGSSTVSGVGAALGTCTGTSAGSSTAAAAGQSTGAGVGAAAGSATADGVSASPGAGDGTAAGSSTVAGVGAALGAGVGTSAGSSTATGVGAEIGAGVGTAAGSATVTGVGTALGAGVGTSTGSATATGVGAAIGTTVGTSAGSAAATGVGVGLVSGVGTSAGSSTATGVGQSIGATVGTAAGSATATAVGQSTGAGAVGSVTVADDTVAGTSSITETGSADITVGDDVTDGTSSILLQGDASLQLADDLVDGVESTTSVIHGDSAITEEADAVAGTGSLLLTGSAAIQMADDSVASAPVHRRPYSTATPATLLRTRRVTLIVRK